MRTKRKAPGQNQVRETLKSTIDGLVCTEVRLLQFGRIQAPSFILEGLSLSIRESKREVVDLTHSLAPKDRSTLVKKMVREAVEEEIERTVQHRGIPCLRCSHLRYYDSELNPHDTLPVGDARARAIGCDRLQTVSRVRCERFAEALGALSVVDYVEEIALLYEVRDMFKKMKEIWGEYFQEP
jgi:hypothetical protein